MVYLDMLEASDATEAAVATAVKNLNEVASALSGNGWKKLDVPGRMSGEGGITYMPPTEVPLNLTAWLRSTRSKALLKPIGGPWQSPTKPIRRCRLPSSRMCVRQERRRFRSLIVHTSEPDHGLDGDHGRQRRRASKCPRLVQADRAPSRSSCQPPTPTLRQHENPPTPSITEARPPAVRQPTEMDRAQVCPFRSRHGR